MSNAPMRILLLNYEFPPIGGGAATASAQIARHLARRGAEVAVLTSHLKGLPYEEQHDGYTIRRVRAMRQRGDRCTVPEMGAFIAGAAIPALRLARKFRPDVMHVFFGMPTGPVGWLASKVTGVPYLLSLRGGDVPGFMGQELAAMHRLTSPLTKLVWSRASVIVANSQGLKSLAQPTAPGRPIEVVPNGVDTEFFRPDEGRRSEGDKMRLLFVGRLANQKGLSYLLRGIAALTGEERGKVELELVGSGPEEKPLRALAEQLGIAANVRFAGWVPREQIVARYQAADVFVLPSLDEGLPNVMLEAMACGNAILATDIRGNQELVQPGANGLLVRAADAPALTAAMSRLLGSPELRKVMGEESRSRASKYDWANTAERYLEMSEQIVTARASRSAGGARTPNKLDLGRTPGRSHE